MARKSAVNEGDVPVNVKMLVFTVVGAVGAIIGIAYLVG